MNTKLKFHLPLALGFLFTSIVGLSFSNGLHFNGFWFFMIPIKLSEVVGTNTDNTILNSCLLGYIFYLIYGVNIIKSRFKNMGSKASAVMFLVITTYTLVIESKFIYNSWQTDYNGSFFHIGVAIFIYGLIVYAKITKKTTP